MRKNNTTTTATAFVMVDGKQVDVDVAGVSLDAIIAEMVDATKTVYGANIRIAAKLNDLMAFDWFDVEHQEVSDNAKALKPHKAAVLAGFKLAGHSNPSKAYADIRKYGRNLRAGYSANGDTMADGSPRPDAGNGEADADNGANPAKRSPMLRNIEELTKLWKFNAGLDATPEKIAAAQSHITAALAALGIDVRTIK